MSSNRFLIKIVCKVLTDSFLYNFFFLILNFQFEIFSFLFEFYSKNRTLMVCDHYARDLKHIGDIN